MRARSLTALAAAAGLAMFSSLAISGPAFGAWDVADQRLVQAQDVCRDGVVIDLASTDDQSGDRGKMTVTVTDLADRVLVKQPKISIPEVPATDVPEMPPFLANLKHLGRNYVLRWGTAREPGSSVVVKLHDSVHQSDSQKTYTVRDCRVDDRFGQVKAGYVWAHHPTTPSYKPGPYWSYNSALKNNTVTRTDVGRYTVTFEGLATSGGNAQVTAFGTEIDVDPGPETDLRTEPELCKIGDAGWRASGSAMKLDVRCFGVDGKPRDSRFSASFTAGGGAGRVVAFARADQKSRPGPYPPADQYNNHNGPISVSRQAVGSYQVGITLHSAARAAGSVKVTAQGGSSTACKISYWDPNDGILNVYVLCFDKGVPTDSRFSIAYVDEANLFGSDRLSAGYVWADGPTPWASYRYSSKGGPETDTITVNRVKTGEYDVVLPFHGGGYHQDASWDGGNAQVTAWGFGTERCQVGRWKDTADYGRVVRVNCFTADGVATDAIFTVQYAAQVR